MKLISLILRIFILLKVKILILLLQMKTSMRKTISNMHLSATDQLLKYFCKQKLNMRTLYEDVII